MIADVWERLLDRRLVRMSYMALYRKWRPRDFDGVVGQDPIVTALKNQIQYQRIGHAYLFCGTRGDRKDLNSEDFRPSGQLFEPAGWQSLQ